MVYLLSSLGFLLVVVIVWYVLRITLGMGARLKMLLRKAYAEDDQEEP